MADQPYGWTCPTCGASWAPWQVQCQTCAAPKTFTGVSLGTITGFSGTVMTPGYYAHDFGNMGTVFYGLRTKTEAEQAEAVIGDWRAKGFAIKTLIDAAVDDLIDRVYEDEDDDE